MRDASDICSVCGHWPEEHSGPGGETCDRCPGLDCQAPDYITLNVLTSDDIELLLGAIESETHRWMGEFSMEQLEIDARLVSERLDKYSNGPPFESEEELKIRGDIISTFNAMSVKLKSALEAHYDA